MKEEENNRAIELMLGYLCVATEPEASITRKVEILDRFELSAKDISIICGCSPQSVLNARLKYRKGRSAKKKKATKKKS